MDRPFYSQKALVADFRDLLRQGHIPQDLAPGKLEGEIAPNLQTLPPSLSTWVGQVTSHLRQYGRQPEDFGEFEYEAYRILYAHGQSRAAIAGMGRLAQGNPRAPVAMPAAKFALDTYLKNAEWLAARELGKKLAQIPEFGNELFQKRLADLAAETSLRSLEQAVDASDFQTAAVLSQEFMVQYSNTPWAPQGLLLSSRVALATGDARQSLQLLNDLITRYPKAENLLSALLLRAGFAESEFNFDGAANDLQQSLTLIRQDAKADSWPPIARRFFLTNWLSSHPRLIDCASYRIDESLHRECERHQGLVLLTAEGGKISPKVALENALKGYDENRAIWSAFALRQFGADLVMKDRLEMAVLLAERWKQLDPLIQFALIDTLNRTLPEMFRVSRQALPTLAPLKANTRSLVKRIGLIRDVETSVEKIVDLPWAQVKISLLATIAHMYLDFSGELTRLPPPKNLSPAEKAQYDASVAEILTPFRAKGEMISKQVKTLAAKTAVNPEVVTDLKVEPSRKLAAIPENELGLLKALLQDIRPPLKVDDNPSPQEKLATLWEEAFQAGAWPRTAFFFQEMKTKFRLRDSTLASLRALALSRSGAKAEALAELEAAIPSLGEPRMGLAQKLVNEWYQSSTASELAPSHVAGSISKGTRP